MTIAGPVLAAYDGRALAAVQCAEQLAQILDCPLHVATAYRYEPSAFGAAPGPGPSNERRFAAAEERLDALGVGAAAGRTTLAVTNIATDLLQLAAELDATAVVLGSDEHGNVTHEVVRRAACALVVAPGDVLLVPPDVQTVGVAFDGSAGSRLALSAAQHLAIRAGARLEVIAVADDERGVETARASAESAAAAVERIDVRTVVLEGDAAATLRATSEHLDLLACGSRGRGAVRAKLLGSVSSKLVADPVRPVLVAPVRARRDAAAPLGLTTAGAG